MFSAESELGDSDSVESFLAIKSRSLLFREGVEYIIFYLKLIMDLFMGYLSDFMDCVRSLRYCVGEFVDERRS